MIGSTDSSAVALREAGSSLRNATQKREAAPSDKLGKHDFLNLMMTQLKHQDPLKPMDSQGMMQQLSQLGALEQLTNMNTTLDGISKGQADLLRANAYSFIEKDVLVKGGTAQVRGGRVNGLNFELPREATALQVFIADAEGNPLRTLELGATAAGRHRVTWDGRDAAGEPVPDGAYRFSAGAKNAEGDTLPVELFSLGKVSAVRFENGRPVIRMNGQDYDARDVTELSRQSQAQFEGRQPLPYRAEMTLRPAVLDKQQ
ncbi:MAG: flagellar hook assembly protein FlgD [Candidatus Lambdaproteobacteria bacterium]|nr:flagellar hook assembly protein FlgD [Candidatus Lambdaproteobacteria bacterium]